MQAAPPPLEETLVSGYVRLASGAEHRRIDLELRALDIVFGVLFGVVALPIAAVIAVVQLVTSGRPILYRGERVGRRGRFFHMLKFRTMRPGAEERIGQYLGEELVHATEAELTRLGRWLKASQLDEIPQLWNVLKGDMSLVGPRPPIPEEVKSYHRWHRRRLSMKPGLTCLWQISGRNNIDFDRWMQLDLQYIDNWSPSLDLKILLRTIPAVLSGKGAS